MNGSTRKSGAGAYQRSHAGHLLAALLAAIFLAGGAPMGEAEERGSIGTAWFSSPEEAVPAISEMLRSEDFRRLASYYDLTGSGIDRGELESGDFFIRRERPEVAHPGGFWRYKHPFAPGFKYSGMTSAPGEGVYTIHLRIEIEQGEGSPPQVGLDSFLMIESEKGWQVLPGEPEEEGVPESVMTAPEPLPDPSWRK